MSDITNILNNINLMYKRKVLLSTIIKQLTPKKYMLISLDHYYNHAHIHYRNKVFIKKLKLPIDNDEQQLITREYLLKIANELDINDIIISTDSIYYNNLIDYLQNYKIKNIDIKSPIYYYTKNIPHEYNICWINYYNSIISKISVDNLQNVTIKEKKIDNGFNWIINEISSQIINKFTNKDNIYHSNLKLYINKYNEFIEFIKWYVLQLLSDSKDKNMNDYSDAFFDLIKFKKYENIKIEEIKINNILSNYVKKITKNYSLDATYIFIIDTGNDIFNKKLQDALKNKYIVGNISSIFDLMNIYYNKTQQSGGNNTRYQYIKYKNRYINLKNKYI